MPLADVVRNGFRALFVVGVLFGIIPRSQIRFCFGIVKFSEQLFDVLFNRNDIKSIPVYH